MEWIIDYRISNIEYSEKRDGDGQMMCNMDHSTVPSFGLYEGEAARLTFSTPLDSTEKHAQPGRRTSIPSTVADQGSWAASVWRAARDALDEMTKLAESKVEWATRRPYSGVRPLYGIGRYLQHARSACRLLPPSLP